MTNKTKFLTALSVGGVLISTTAGFMVVNAQSATTTTNSGVTTSSISSSQPPMGKMFGKMEAVKTALDNKDYNAWKAAIKDAPNAADQLAKIDTQAKFDQLVQAHEYLKNNEPDKAKAIFDTLGLQLPQRGMGKGFGDKNGAENTQEKAVKTALDNSDYTAWQTAIKATPNGDQILSKVDTSDKFNQLATAHKQVKDAIDNEKKVVTDLGIQDLIKPKMEHRMGMPPMLGQPNTTTTTNQ